MGLIWCESVLHPTVLLLGGILWLQPDCMKMRCESVTIVLSCVASRKLNAGSEGALVLFNGLSGLQVLKGMHLPAVMA